MKHVTQTLKFLGLAGVLVFTQNQVLFSLAPKTQGVDVPFRQAEENFKNVSQQEVSARQTSFPKATAKAIEAYWEGFSGDSTKEKARNIRKAGTIDTRYNDTGIDLVRTELQLDKVTVEIVPTQFIISPEIPFIATHKTEKIGNAIRITPQIDRATMTLEPRIAYLKIFEVYDTKALSLFIWRSLANTRQTQAQESTWFRDIMQRCKPTPYLWQRVIILKLWRKS